MKSYFVMLFFMTGYCFAQTIDDLNQDQKLIYNRNKLSIEVVKKTEGAAAGSAYGNLAAGSYSGESWNHWIAYKGLGMKISESEFLNLTGYVEEAKMAKGKYENSHSKAWRYCTFALISIPAYVIGIYDAANDDGNETIANILIPTSLVGMIWGLSGSIKYSKLKRKNYTPYSSVVEIMENYNRNLIKDIYNNRF